LGHCSFFTFNRLSKRGTSLFAFGTWKGSGVNKEVVQCVLAGKDSPFASERLKVSAMNQAMRSLPRAKDKMGLLAFHAMRLLEKGVSPTGLYLALAPLAFALAAFSFNRRVPAYFGQPPSPLHAWRSRMNCLLGHCLEFIPDRLATAKWQARFQTAGLGRLQEARQRKRRVVLVFLHFGAFKLIPILLRVLGISVISLLEGESSSRSSSLRMKDKLSPFSPLPTVFYREDQLRGAVEVLRAGHVLFVALDRRAGKEITIPIDEHWSFRMATGAIRLAAKCDAELMPCCMIDQGCWQFRLEIGQPVPLEFLTPRLDAIGAAQHLLRELLPTVSRHPEFCVNTLMRSLRPNRSISRGETLAV
jgi:hypothetical protein